MSDTRPRLHFDYVDPGSFLMDLRIGRVARDIGLEVVRVPFEVRPPPDALVDPEDAGWRAYWARVAEEIESEGVRISRPALVPWTRKSHELAFHAREEGRFPSVHEALFRRFLVEGRDIGRIDVLLEVAVAAGFDSGATKAVLDVDRHARAVTDARAVAEAAGVRGVPTLEWRGRLLEGNRDEGAIRAFLVAED